VELRVSIGVAGNKKMKGAHHESSYRSGYSKGKSDGQVFLDKGQPYRPPFCFHHNQEGLMQLLDIIADVQDKTKKPPTVILESTGHYHQAVIQFLEEHGILFLVVNPLISHQAKKSSLRKVKTDAVDAYRLCELYYKEEFEDHKQRGFNY
jgi:transposase